MINNTGEVCNQAGGPALRKADPPSSQAYSCHSMLAHTPTEPRSRLGSSATNYLNMVLKGPLKRAQLETVENCNNTKRNRGRFKSPVVWTQSRSPVHNFTDFRGRERKSVESPFSNSLVYFVESEGGRPIKPGKRRGEEENLKN